MIDPTTIVEPSADIGLNPNIGFYNVIRDGAVIGDNVYISHHCVIARGTIIGDDVFIGPGVIFTNTKHICHGRDRAHTGDAEPIIVRRGARIGAGVTILPGVVIGEESEIGAGSVVTKSTEPYCMYWGNPAHFQGKVSVNQWLRKPDRVSNMD